MFGWLNILELNSILIVLWAIHSIKVSFVMFVSLLCMYSRKLSGLVNCAQRSTRTRISMKQNGTEACWLRFCVALHWVEFLYLNWVHFVVLCCVALCCVVLCCVGCVVLCCAVLCCVELLCCVGCVVLCCFVLVVLCFVLLCLVVLSCVGCVVLVVLCFAVLCCAVLCCVMLCWVELLCCVVLCCVGLQKKVRLQSSDSNK